MKPGKRDIKVKILITGRELEELQKHTWSMAESFGLDRRIGSYRGKRPIGLYSWDLECLLAVLSIALKNYKEYTSEGAKEHEVTQRLYQRLKRIYDSTYERGLTA